MSESQGDVALTEAQLARKANADAKKAEKLAKLEAKNKKLAAIVPKKEDKKEKKETIPVITYTGSTLDGDKKDITSEFPETYSPLYVEAAWYEWWEKEGFFRPEYNAPNGDVSAENPKGRFMICIPPPNVTGTLHLGHALTTAIEDAIVRWNRMHGRTTLWNPGCDHAGIATQVVVEKKIMREEGKTRHDIGREKFVEKVWDWRNEKGHQIYHQLKRLGGSYDWTRTVFTMDPKMCTAVTEGFIRLHEKGLIYRANRLVNWSCTLKSAISDIEVDKKEIKGKTAIKVPGYDKPVMFGILTEFAYPLCDKKGNPKCTLDGICEIVVATTRIETMLGDSAVAVHPDDPKYQSLDASFHVKHPFSGKALPIVRDDFVELGFGTGAVKITPAHDANDFACGKRHNLDFLTIITDTGDVLAPFCGPLFEKPIPRFTARKVVLDELKKLDLYRGEKDNPMVVPVCSRSKDIIEPLLKPQWYVKQTEMAPKACEVVRSGELKITPAFHEKTWYSWMENPIDWCVSRQLWWGHRIPAYKVTPVDPTNRPISACGDDSASSSSDGPWIVARSLDEAKTQAAAKYPDFVFEKDYTLEQDPDVLDTWFSSGLFPFSIFGWPNQTKDLEAFYPGDVLETGHDILFFWVARMVMLGQALIGKLPFHTVYLHPIVRDPHGRKMSKSLGNVVDPLDVIHGISLEKLNSMLENSNLDPSEVGKAIEGQKRDYPNGIPECGVDALRFCLCSYLMPTRDINLDVLRVHGYRKFCNKIWNCLKFSLSGLGDGNVKEDIAKNNGRRNQFSHANQWILCKLRECVATCENGFKTFEFPSVTQAIHSFWLYHLCDNYLEAIKPVLGVFSKDPCLASPELQSETRAVLFTCLDVALRCLHPLMPFITEELWQRLVKPSDGEAKSITVAEYPTLDNVAWLTGEAESETRAIAQVDLALSLVRQIRQMRADYNVAKSARVSIFVSHTDACDCVPDEECRSLISTLASTEPFACRPAGSQSTEGHATQIVCAGLSVHIDLTGQVDVQKERARLQSKQTALASTVAKLETTFASEGYLKKASANTQATDQAKLQTNRDELAHVEAAIQALGV